MNFLLNVTWFCDSLCTHATLFSVSACRDFEHLCDRVFLMTEWVRNLVGFSLMTPSKKITLKDWQPSMDKTLTPSQTLRRQFPAPLLYQSLEGQRTEIVTSSVSNLGAPHQHRSLRGRQLVNLMRQLGSSRALRAPRPSGKNWRHHCLHKKRISNFVHPKQHGPCPERL